MSQKSDPSGSWELLTASPADRLPAGVRSVLFTTAGDATFVDGAGRELPMTGVAANTVYPIKPQKMTSATATVYGLF